jgi:hypothetical protein
MLWGWGAREEEEESWRRCARICKPCLPCTSLPASAFVPRCRHCSEPGTDQSSSESVAQGACRLDEWMTHGATEVPLGEGTRGGPLHEAAPQRSLPSLPQASSPPRRLLPRFLGRARPKIGMMSQGERGPKRKFKTWERGAAPFWMKSHSLPRAPNYLHTARTSCRTTQLNLLLPLPRARTPCSRRLSTP